MNFAWILQTWPSLVRKNVDSAKMNPILGQRNFDQNATQAPPNATGTQTEQSPNATPIQILMRNLHTSSDHGEHCDPSRRDRASIPQRPCRESRRDRAHVGVAVYLVMCTPALEREAWGVLIQNGVRGRVLAEIIREYDRLMDVQREMAAYPAHHRVLVACPSGTIFSMS